PALGVPPRLDAIPRLAAAPHRRGADGRLRLLARLSRPPEPRPGERVRYQGDLLDRVVGSPRPHNAVAAYGPRHTGGAAGCAGSPSARGVRSPSIAINGRAV